MPLKQKKGGALRPIQIKQLIDASYETDKNRPDQIGDYILDRSIGGQHGSVYFNPKTQKAVVVHRGTDNTLGDWMNNFYYVTGRYKHTDRYKKGKNIQQLAEQKYGAENIDTTLGHSQGSILARELGNNTKNITQYNPARLFESQKKNENILRSEKDIVSLATPIHDAFGKVFYPKTTANRLRKNKTIPNESWLNVIENHNTPNLEKLDENEEIGKGLKQGRSTWIDHVKSVQKKNGISYKEALQLAKKSYKK